MEKESFHWRARARFLEFRGDQTSIRRKLDSRKDQFIFVLFVYFEVKNTDQSAEMRHDRSP